mmetsp:Transcript_33602/g.63176  ORF Transcript_33602/g.63176 Transcript_33602/m.63176 type:complete len:353 (-) Transcript_33602:541-1599(-)
MTRFHVIHATLRLGIAGWLSLECSLTIIQRSFAHTLEFLRQICILSVASKDGVRTSPHFCSVGGRHHRVKRGGHPHEVVNNFVCLHCDFAGVRPPGLFQVLNDVHGIRLRTSQMERMGLLDFLEPSGNIGHEGPLAGSGLQALDGQVHKLLNRALVRKHLLGLYQVHFPPALQRLLQPRDVLHLLAGDDLAENEAEGKHVRVLVVALALLNLRGQVRALVVLQGESAFQLKRGVRFFFHVSGLVLGERAGESEVRHLGHPAIEQQHVGALQVPVQDGPHVQVLHRLGDLHREVQTQGGGEVALVVPDQVVQAGVALAPGQLQHQAHAAPLDVRPKDERQVGVTHVREGVNLR